jgi:hypothetical protein
MSLASEENICFDKVPSVSAEEAKKLLEKTKITYFWM